MNGALRLTLPGKEKGNITQYWNTTSRNRNQWGHWFLSGGECNNNSPGNNIKVPSHQDYQRIINVTRNTDRYYQLLWFTWRSNWYLKDCPVTHIYLLIHTIVITKLGWQLINLLVLIWRTTFYYFLFISFYFYYL
jgi:hypothetical protein